MSRQLRAAAFVRWRRHVLLLSALAPGITSCATAEELGEVYGDASFLGIASGGDSATGGGPAASGAPSSGTGGALTAPQLPGAGGTIPSAGGASAGGSPSPGAGGQAGPGNACPSGQKACDGACVLFSPSVGCGGPGCSPCERPPSNGYAACVDQACDFDCLLGYQKTGSSCQSTGSGGAGVGSGGRSNVGGASTSGSCPTSPMGCPDCGVVLGPGCCAQSRCGCPLIPWTAGLLGCL